jgi:cysteinyl-tRNA synthetase
MSKSLGNVKNIRELLASWDGESLRAFLLSTSYRHPINFTDAALADADRRVEYFYDTLAKADAYLAQKKLAGTARAPEDALARFRAAMEDDFNTAEALAGIEAIYRQINARIDGKAKAEEVARLLAAARELSGVLGLAARPAREAIASRRLLAARRKGLDPAWVEERIGERIAARKAKDFVRADAIRDEVAAKGVELRDAPGGTDWRVLL